MRARLRAFAEETRGSVTVEAAIMLPLLALYVFLLFFTPLIGEHGKGVLFDVPLDEMDQTIDVDEGRVMQMLVNLLDNAVKFSPRGGIVRINVKTRRRHLHLVVADSDPGIPEAERAAVFERFTRKARGDDPHSAGSGLGLTITRALAKLNGGTVSVGESPEGGAQFTISLPL